MTDELLTRIERLEKSNRRLKRFGGALLGGFVGLALLGAAATTCDTVWAERFVLKDSRGKQRMMLDAYSTGTPTVAFYDNGGKTLAQLAIPSEGEARLDLFQGKQKTTSILRVSAEGAPYWTCEGGGKKSNNGAPEKGGASAATE